MRIGFRTLLGFRPAVVMLTAAVLLLVGCGESAAPVAVATPPPSSTPLPPAAAPILPPPSPLPPPASPTPWPVVAQETAAAANEPAPPPTATAAPPPSPTAEIQLGGIPLSDIVVLPPETIDNMKSVFAAGQEAGRNPYRFSKLGDSVIANADFLTRFDKPGSYELGPYADLAPVIDHFSGSWDRFGVAIRIGLHAWGVFDPMWANKEWCDPNEVMIDCEYRLNNPAVVLIHLGSNDTTDSFPRFMRRVIEETLDAGIIPIVMTKADRFEGEDNRNNEAMRALAAEYEVPLLDFDVVAQTLPNRGLKEDNVHMDGPLQHDYNLAEAMEKGHSVHNLVVLFMLDALLEKVIEPGLDPERSAGSEG